MVGGVLCACVAPAPHPPFLFVCFVLRVWGLCGVVDVADEFVLVINNHCSSCALSLCGLDAVDLFGYVSEFCGRSDTWLILIPAVDVLMVDAMTIDVADPATLGSAVDTMIVVSLVLMVTGIVIVVAGVTMIAVIGMIVDGMTGGTGMMTAVSPAMIVILVMIAVIVIIGRVTIGIRVVSVGIPMVMRVGAHRVVGIVVIVMGNAEMAIGSAAIHSVQVVAVMRGSVVLVLHGLISARNAQLNV